jgi:hypothetical protein
MTVNRVRAHVLEQRIKPALGAYSALSLIAEMDRLALRPGGVRALPAKQKRYYGQLREELNGRVYVCEGERGIRGVSVVIAERLPAYLLSQIAPSLQARLGDHVADAHERKEPCSDELRQQAQGLYDVVSNRC